MRQATRTRKHLVWRTTEALRLPSAVPETAESPDLHWIGHSASIATVRTLAPGPRHAKRQRRFCRSSTSASYRVRNKTPSRGRASRRTITCSRGRAYRPTSTSSTVLQVSFIFMTESIAYITDSHFIYFNIFHGHKAILFRSEHPFRLLSINNRPV